MNKPADCTVIGAADVVDAADDVEEELLNDDEDGVLCTDEDEVNDDEDGVL